MAERHTVFLGFPGNSMGFQTSWALWRASNGRHDIIVANSGGSWDNFNALLAMAINTYNRGACTHTAQLHGDVEPEMAAGPSGTAGPAMHWLDVALDVMNETGAALVSAAIPIKDHRGALSCGIGDPNDPWSPFRRLTMWELDKLPDVFDAGDIAVVHGHPRDYYDGCPLIHNNGLWVADLRNPVFHQTNEGGDLLSYFNFPKRVARDESDNWKVYGESEDWYFSRFLHKVGAKTVITKRIRLVHKDGGTPYPNYGVWGTKQHDDDTAKKWRAREEREEKEAALEAQEVAA